MADNIDSNGVSVKNKKTKDNDIIIYNPIGEGNKMTEQVLDEMSQKAYDAGFGHGSGKKKKENPFDMGSRKRAFYNQGYLHGHALAKDKRGLDKAKGVSGSSAASAISKDDYRKKTKFVNKSLRNESPEIIANDLNEALEAFDGSDEMLVSFLENYGNSNGDDRGGSPTAPVPTTKTGILSQLSDWGLSNEYTGAASHMEYSALKALVGQATKDTVNDVFKKAVGNAANTTGAETMDKDKEASGQIKEHIDAIFNGVELTEEGKAKVTTVFEAAVASVLAEQVKSLEEEALEEIEARVEEIEAGLVEKMDQYLTYVAENWRDENKLALESAVKAEIAESFMQGLKTLFEDHYVDIPASKIDAFAEMTAKVEELTASLDEQVKKNIALSGNLNESKKAAILTTVAEGLTLTESEKLKGLVETVSFEGDEDYTKKVTHIRESYFKKSEKVLSEETETPAKKPLTEKNEPKVKDWLSVIPTQAKI